MFLYFIPSVAFADSVERIAEIADVEGKASVKIQTRSRWQSAEVGMILKEGSIVKTAIDSSITLYIDGKVERSAEVVVNENSQMRFAEFLKDESQGTTSTLLDLAIGKILIEVDKLREEGSRFEVKTPTSIVGVRGTVFEVQVDALD